MSGDFILSRDDWSLHRKGHVDQQRHQEKVREALKKNLADIVSEESIIMSDGKQIVKVPIRSLDEFRFRYDSGKQKHVGQGDGKSKVGDVIAKDQGNGARGPGKGEEAGSEPGVDYYEAEVTLEDVEHMLFKELALPNLQEKSAKELETETIRFNDIRKKGLTGNIDKKRTLIEALKRNAKDGKAGFHPIYPDDLRYKTWDVHHEHQSSAVILAMMDTSGSMGNFEKYIARTFFFWMVRFLRTKYKNVQIVFIAHHTEAKVVTEEEFFTKGESGGTRCSSAYRLALELIQTKYPPRDYNIYPFHFSDGDNLSSDNEMCVKLVKEMLPMVNQFGYGEIVRSHFTSTLMNSLKRIQDQKFAAMTIKDRTEVYGALKHFFKPSVEATG